MLNSKLKTLLAVAEYKNYTKVAKALSLTQPAVSHHISQLEEECGAALFFRTNGEYKLTPEGEIAATYAKRLLALHQKMLQEIQDEQRLVSRLRIGITHTAENNTITETLAKYAQLNPKTSITLIAHPINILYEMLENFELDMAIVEGQRKDSHLNYFMLDTDYLACVLSNNNPLSKKEMVTVSELKQQNMILRLPSSATRQLFEASLLGINENINSFTVSLEVDNVATIKDLVRKDLGVSILPRSACLQEMRGHKLTVVPIENLSMMRETNIAYNKDFTHMEMLNDMIKLYKQMTGLS